MRAMREGGMWPGDWGQQIGETGAEAGAGSRGSEELGIRDQQWQKRHRAGLCVVEGIGIELIFSSSLKSSPTISHKRCLPVDKTDGVVFRAGNYIHRRRHLPYLLAWAAKVKTARVRAKEGEVRES